jgi:hypothetical protein
MKVDTTGNLTIFVQGEEGKKLSLPHHLVLDTQDNLYSVGDSDGVIWRITPDAQTTQVYPPTDWRGIGIIGFGGDPFTVDLQGNIFWINYRQEKFTQILKISTDGRITTLAGGDYGLADGQGAQARFGYPHAAGFAWGPDGSLYLTDSLIYVRKITPTGNVTTVADSSGKRVEFKDARGLACDALGNIYVADGSQRRVFQCTPTGKVAVVAGSGQRGGTDGPAAEATFEEPVGVAVAHNGSIYVLDYIRDDPRVRKVSTDRSVTTIATTVKAP